MAPPSKPNVKITLKEILQKALVPQVLITFTLVFIHWVIVSIWLYKHYQETDATKLLFVSLLGGSLPIIAYSLWGLRKFLMKSFLIIHNRILKFWIRDFCDEIAKTISNNKDQIVKQYQPEEIIIKFKAWVLIRVDLLPIFIKKITLLILKKVGISSEFDEKILLIKNGTEDDIAELVHHEISNLLIQSSNKVMPFWVVYLIPINIILLLCLWFL